jgi:1-acyl-sn-glycerol-3-phosphate acyltransferase
MKSFNLYLRSFLFFCGQTFASIFFCLGGLLLAPFPFQIRYRFITGFSHFVIWFAKALCGIEYKIQGAENLPQDSAIVLCKHQSAWETLFLQVLLPPQTWVLKKQLLYIPFFGWGLALLEPIAIDRTQKNSALKQLIEQGRKRLKQGRWVVIFPEGSRVPVGEKAKFSRSGVMLAKETGNLIVPISHNAGLFWPKNSFLRKPGTVEVVIGKPLDPKLLTADMLQAETIQFIEENSR